MCKPWILAAILVVLLITCLRSAEKFAIKWSPACTSAMCTWRTKPGNKQAMWAAVKKECGASATVAEVFKATVSCPGVRQKPATEIL